MKKSFFFLITLLTTNCFAISNAELVRVCSQVGREKVLAQAQAYGCTVDPRHIRVSEIDNRRFNPSKYMWFVAMGPCKGMDRVSALVQYYQGRCF